MTNSIFSNLDKNSFFAELRLQKSDPTNQNKGFVILEGYSDILLVSKFLNDSCLIFESYGGKRNIIDVLNNQLFNDERIIGIVDKDYYCPDIFRLFCYDYCNCEMMVISNQTVFNHTIEHFLLKHGDYSVLKNEILESLATISAIRKINIEKALNLEFTHVDLNRLIRDSYLETNKVIAEFGDTTLLNDYSANQTQYELEIETIKKNPLDFTNGHDFLSSINACIRKMGLGVCNNLSEKNARKILYSYFSVEDFKTTKLFKKIFEYEQSGKIRFLLNDI